MHIKICSLTVKYRYDMKLSNFCFFFFSHFNKKCHGRQNNTIHQWCIHKYYDIVSFKLCTVHTLLLLFASISVLNKNSMLKFSLTKLCSKFKIKRDKRSELKIEINISEISSSSDCTMCTVYYTQGCQCGIHLFLFSFPKMKLDPFNEHTSNNNLKCQNQFIEWIQLWLLDLLEPKSAIKKDE